MMRPRRLAPIAFLFLVSAQLVDHAGAAPGDENWDALFALPGVTGQGFTGEVFASAEFEGDLVIGGYFSAVGALSVMNLARWDGIAWAPMGEPLDGEVEALIVWNSELYAGGYFTLDGGTALSSLARWDGGAWVEVGGGFDGTVYDLAIWNGDLVVAGYSDGGSSVVVWDGVSWDDLDGGTDGVVFGVEVYTSSLYACGQFSIAGGALADNLARWNGTSWFGVGGGLADAFGDPGEALGKDLVVHDGQLVIAGTFERAGSLTVDGIARWNGTSFSTNGSPFFGGNVNALGLWGTNLVAAGEEFTSIGLWNGMFWNPLGSIDGGIYTFLDFGSDLIAGGIFTTLNGAPAASLARYDGTWSPMATGQGAIGQRVDAFHDWNDTVIVGGRLSSIGTVPGLIAAWDGAAWTSLGTGIHSSSGVSRVLSMASFEDDLIVSGSFSAAGGVPVNNIARWDGATWSAMGAASGGGELLVLDGVLYANGYWSGGHTLGQWNGTDFDALGTSIAGGAQLLYSLGSFQGDVVMGGSFTSVDGVAASNIARWDGSSWQSLGSGTSGVIYAVHPFGGVLYAAGSFTMAGGVPALSIAAWDGTTWSALAGGLFGTVRALASVGADLYATGSFTEANGQPVGRIARWDGLAWHALGSGLDDDGWALLGQDDDLWVGGGFSFAGTSASFRVARWSAPGALGVPPSLEPTSLRMGAARPNPFAAVTEISFALSVATDVSVDVFDVRGARIRAMTRTGLDVGTHTVTWDGYTSAGRPAPAGTYFVGLRGGASSARQRVVIVR